MMTGYTFLYNLGLFAVDIITVQLPKISSMIVITLFSYSSQKSSWTLLILPLQAIRCFCKIYSNQFYNTCAFSTKHFFFFLNLDLGSYILLPELLQKVLTTSFRLRSDNFHSTFLAIPILVCLKSNISHSVLTPKF